ncbi:MAG TPA: hypothetical protein G4N92_07905 [Anaerolineae bacterium]|nr:hypothetical protein [Anaerolineae bacterium]
MNLKPAIGERSAAGGYRPQYIVGASIIYDTLEKGDLEWIKVADPEAGRVDDFQIATTARVDAFQVKWEKYTGAISYNDIAQSKKSAPSLFSQLYNGREKLKKSNPTRRVVVHLVTNQFPSSSTRGKMPKTVSSPAPYHFSAFIEQAWKPAHKDGTIDLTNSWKPVWEEIQKSLGLSLEEFNDFVMDCCLDFKYNLPKKAEDIIAIANLLFETSASPEFKIKLSRREIINRLGWKQRYSTWNAHEFPEPKYLYRPIQNTVENLISRIDTLKGGYIGVFGSQGSGKSTLLTQTLRTLPVRLFKYYAYIPDSKDSSTIRGESLNFLHDITLKLSRAGFRGNSKSKKTERIGLLKLFNEQLNALGSDYKTSHEKIIILIDGLDHIAREQHPEHSLLNDLPFPQEIPDGVYIVLGSQTDELIDLPMQITHELKLDNHRVEMGKLTPSDTRAIANVTIPKISDELNQKVFEMSNGHPLALFYLLKNIQKIPSSTDRLGLLEKAEPFEGDINKQYLSHWQECKGDEELISALGLLSRLRDPIPMKWVATWANESVLRKIEKLLLTFFEKDSQERWVFFHNSFRLFLIDRTSDPLPGQTREQRNQNLHLELANKFKKAKAPWYWETLYHYYFAEDYKSVVSIATWDWFLQQLKSLRPLDAIQADIRLALLSAGKCRDTVMLARLTLLGAAIQQRSIVLEDYPISDLLILCGKPNLAASHVRDGNRLRVETKQALKTSAGLFEAGSEREAYRIFELSEPLELLSGITIPNNHTYPQNLRDILRAWVRSAILFRNADEIVKTIKQIRLPPRLNSTRTIEVESKELHNWLIFHGALNCCQLNDWNSWEIFYNSFVHVADQTMKLFTLLRTTEYVYDHDGFTRLDKFLPDLLSFYPPGYFKKTDKQHWTLEACTSLAELLSSIEEYKKEAVGYVKIINPIPLYDSDLGYDKQTIQQGLRFRKARIQYLIGDTRKPIELLRESESCTQFLEHMEEDEKESYKQIALATYTLARLWSWGKTGNQLSSTSFMLEIKWIVDLFGSRWGKLSIRSRVNLRESRFDILNCVILAAKQHGKEVLIAVRNDLENRWQNTKEKINWWPKLQRKLIESFSKTIIDKDWTKSQLLRIASLLQMGLEPYAKVEECKAQAEAWLLIDEKEEARKELARMVDAARGISSDKDYQLSEWVKWLGHINDFEQKNQKGRIQLMLQRLTSVKETASGVISASEEMLGVVYKWNPSRAIELLKSMLEKNYVSFEAGINQLLSEALNLPDPPCEEIQQIILNLIIPFAPRFDPNILEKFILVKADQESDEQAKDCAQFFLDRICVDTVSENRFEWAQSIFKGLEKIGVSKEIMNIRSTLLENPNVQNSSQIDRNLYLQNGDRIPLDDVLHSIKTIADLKKVLKNEDESKSTYFDWTTVVKSLVPMLNDEMQLKELEEIMVERLSKDLSGDTHLGWLHIALSKRYKEFSFVDSAWDHAHIALDFSNSSGWASYWDGGIRLEALRQLKAIDSKKTDGFIFDLYASDLSEESYYPTSFILNLNEILELLNNKISIPKIWAEIEKYLGDLFISVDVEENSELEYAINKPSVFTGSDNSHLSFMQFLIMFLAYPSYPIAQGAVRVLAEVLPTNIDINADLINQMLSSSNDLVVERLLMTLDAVSINKDQLLILEVFRNNLSKLSYSSNFAIRLISSKLIARINNSSPKIGYRGTQLPSIFQIQLPEVSFHETGQTNNNEETPILVGDPARILRPFDIELRVIAKLSNLPINNVLYRAKQYFDTFVIDRNWLYTGKLLSDRELSTFLTNTGVWTSHCKPHIFAARQSLAYIVTELWDCGLLGMNNINDFQMMFSNYDPMFIIRRPSIRPEFIKPIGGREDGYSYSRFPNNWVEDSIESIQLLTTTTDNGQIILGESTKFKFLQEDWPIETRYSLVKNVKTNNFWSVSDLDKGYAPFYRVMKETIEYYPNIKAPKDHIVISNDAYGFETAGANWLALNPEIGYTLGWRTIPGNCFQWIDSFGNTVVSSLWWRDGCFEINNPHKRVEVGEGWLVVVSKSAFEEIKKLLPNLNRGGVIKRSIGQFGLKGSNISKQILSI